MRVNDKKDLYSLIRDNEVTLHGPVEFAPGMKSFDNFMGLANLIKVGSGREDDIVTLEGLSPYIGPHILKEVEFIAF
jgi:hypothetical protein